MEARLAISGNTNSSEILRNLPTTVTKSFAKHRKMNMDTVWKFSMLDAEDDVMDMIDDLLGEVDGVTVRGKDVYIAKLEDAFTFRMRAGNWVSTTTKVSVGSETL